MFGGDNELGNILQEAVKLKSAQMGQKRITYEKWPYFVQHTLFHGEKEDFKAWRQLPFDEKIKISEGIKDEGNKLYAKGSWSDAVDKYEEAATLVHYCYSTDPGWRKNNRGIDDDVLVLVEDIGSNDEEAKQQIKLRMTCALNLAACKQKLEKYEEAVVACDVALELDPDNVKALYRRAEARIRPSKATAYDHDLAILDLQKAHKQEPKNPTVKTLLGKLQGERKVQREKDSKTFTGMFGRGEIYDKDMETAQAPCQSELEMREIQARIENITDDDTLEKRCEDAELLRDLYMRNGKEDDARELNEKIKVAKNAMKERDEPKPRMDWSCPSEEMLLDAKKYDLDLNDPMVIQELMRLEKEGLTDEPPEGEDFPEDSARAAPTPFDLQMPSEADMSAIIPWVRYVVLFVAMLCIWRVIDAGVLKWIVVSICLRIARLPRTFVGFLQPEDEDSGGFRAAIHRVLAGIVIGHDEDGEL